MNNRKPRPRGRRVPLIAVMAICMLPFVLANTCFDTSTAPDYVPTGADTGDARKTDTVTTSVVSAPILPDSGG